MTERNLTEELVADAFIRNYKRENVEAIVNQSINI